MEDVHEKRCSGVSGADAMIPRSSEVVKPSVAGSMEVREPGSGDATAPGAAPAPS